MKINYKDKHDFYISDNLRNPLNTLCYNVSKDFDFVTLVSGDRMTRVGKSVLAQQMAAYMAHILNKMGLNDDAFGIDNIFFDADVMMDECFKKKKYDVIIYDEGREGLGKGKMGNNMQKILDFFAEAGQLNLIFIVVCPDFFELKEEIAIGKAELLVNVYRVPENKELDILKDGNVVPVTKFNRGQYEVYPRNRKGFLYDKFRSTRSKKYNVNGKSALIGKFKDTYCVDKEEYKRKKREALSRFKDRKDSDSQKKYVEFRDHWVLEYKSQHPKATGKEISEKILERFNIELSERCIQRIVKAGYKGDVGL